MASRLLAVLAAVGMVAGAFVYRYGMPGGDGSDDAGPGASGATIYCAKELGSAVCDAVPDAEVESTERTAARLIEARSASDAGVAAWITPGPWAEIVEAELATKTSLLEPSKVLATSPLVVVTRKAQPIAGCPETVTWRCIGDAAQVVSFRLAADPGSTPAGLFTRAAALGGFVESTDYPINDLEEVPNASSWLDNLDRKLDGAGSFGAGSLDQFLITPGAATGYITTKATIDASKTSNFVVAAPAPEARVLAMVARATGSKIRIDEGRLREALESAGWSLDPPKPDDGLPSPGVLAALRGRLE